MIRNLQVFKRYLGTLRVRNLKRIVKTSGSEAVSKTGNLSAPSGCVETGKSLFWTPCSIDTAGWASGLGEGLHGTHTMCFSRILTPRHCTMLGVSVPERLVFGDTGDVPHENLATFLQKLRTSHVSSPYLAATLRYCLAQALLTMTYQPNQLALIEARNQLQSEIIELVDKYVGEARQIGVPASPTKALRVVSQAREYIEQHRDLPIIVTDLCKHTCTSGEDSNGS